jgi:RNA polymerase sigma-70 factor (ECF subfamily)
MRAAGKPKTMILEERKDIDIEAFYTRYGPMVLRRCRKLLGDEQAAHDAMQEVFLKVLAFRERLTGDYPSALLFRIATNICLNRLREDRRHGLRGYPPHLRELVLAPAHEAAVSAGNLLDHLFEHERDEARQIAVMYFVDGMTLKEIGAALELSTSGVHKRIDRLRRRIRSLGGSG